MSRPSGRLEALLAAAGGAATALLARLLLGGLYLAHQQEPAVLRWFDAAVIGIGTGAAVLLYRLLRAGPGA
ncbi:hypothetical protein [Streptomyces sp. FH025]|uniref:hypothetical protein n=1 Tax=Streptomyces sp. FH025 TaxID=2815937 RepID=UPI001A9DDBCF|nr:hypothetical protein [Streptomyces sp. FH025]MBO1418831.1 hypothetical protein [Streptomyces sp. FH025]